MDTGLARWSAPLTGVLFVGLFIAGFIFMSNAVPDSDAADQEFIDFYDDSGNRWMQIIGAFCFAGAGLSFMWFGTALRARIRRWEANPGWPSDLIVVGAVAFAAMLFAAAASWVLISGSIEISEVDPEQYDVSTMRAFGDLGFPLLLIFGALAASLAVAAASWSILDTKALPDWLGALGLFVALVVLFSVFFFPILALLVWVLAASVALALDKGKVRQLSVETG
jgi:hypothetical protein